MNDQQIKLLVAELKRDENVLLKPYLDSVGKLTIGTGRNLEDVGISLDENDYLLMNDIYRVARELDQQLPWWRELDSVRQRVLMNMGFNLGVTNLLGFKRTLPFVQSGRYDAAATEMLVSQWANQVKQRAVRLAQMMRIGQA